MKHSTASISKARWFETADNKSVYTYCEWVQRNRPIIDALKAELDEHNTLYGYFRNAQMPVQSSVVPSYIVVVPKDSFNAVVETAAIELNYPIKLTSLCISEAGEISEVAKISHSATKATPDSTVDIYSPLEKMSINYLLNPTSEAPFTSWRDTLKRERTKAQPVLPTDTTENVDTDIESSHLPPKKRREGQFQSTNHIR